MPPEEGTSKAPPTAPPPVHQSDVQQKLKALQIIQQMISAQEKVLREQQGKGSTSQEDSVTTSHMDIDLHVDADDPSYVQASFSLLATPGAQEADEAGTLDLHGRPPVCQHLPSDEFVTDHGMVRLQTDSSSSSGSPTTQRDTHKTDHSPSLDEAGSQSSLIDVLPLLPSDIDVGTSDRVPMSEQARYQSFPAHRESRDANGRVHRGLSKDPSSQEAPASVDQLGRSLEERRRDQLRLLNKKIATTRGSSETSYSNRDHSAGLSPSSAEVSVNALPTSTLPLGVLTKAQPVDVSHNIPLEEYQLPGVPQYGHSNPAVLSSDTRVLGDDPSVLRDGTSVLDDVSLLQYGYMESRASTLDDVSGECPK